METEEIEPVTDDEIRERSITAFRQRDGQRLRAQANARADYQATLSEAIKDVFGSSPELSEDLEAGKSIEIYGLNVGLNPESKLIVHLPCGKCGGAHTAQLSSLADAGRVYSDPSFVEKMCKGRPKDFEGDLLLVLSDIRDALKRIIPSKG